MSINVKHVFSDIGHGLEWFGEEVAKPFEYMPKALHTLIVASEDAKTIASDAADEVILIAEDVTGLLAAVKKDDGASLAAIGTFLANSKNAIAAEGLNFIDDADAVQSAVTFFKTLNGTNYPDVLAAIAKIINDGKTMTTKVITDFERLKADVKVSVNNTPAEPIGPATPSTPQQ